MGLQVKVHVGAVVVGVHVADACFTGDDIIGLLGLGFIGDDTLVGALDLIGAVSEERTGGLFRIGGVGRLGVDVIRAVIQCDQGLVGLAALGHKIGVHVTAGRGSQLVLGVALAAHHEAAVLHQGDLTGSILHVVHFVAGLVAGGFLSRQILGVVVGVAGAVLALSQHADAGLHGQHIAFTGVGAGHAEVLRGVGTFANHGALVEVQLVGVLGGQNQQVSGLELLVAAGFFAGGQIGLLVEGVDVSGFLRGVFLGLQLRQDLIGAVVVVDRIDDPADGRTDDERHKDQEGQYAGQDFLHLLIHFASPLRPLLNFTMSRTVNARNTTAARDEKMMPSIRENCHQFMLLTTTPFSFMALELATVYRMR